jgi:hypothetical protein
VIGLIQRVTQARVNVDQEVIGQITQGLLVLVCAERHDTEKEADALLDKLLAYRVFPDENGKMNRSVVDIAGQLLLVPVYAGRRHSVWHASVLHTCRIARKRTSIIRSFHGTCEASACRCAGRTIRRPHASLPDE